MEVGEYGRTENGEIIKYVNLQYSDGTPANFKLLVKNNVVTNDRFYEKIVKHSKNIIDLIEVGDYVNGRKVYQVGFNFQDDFVLKMSESNYENFIYPNEIKSIVTKEQFKVVEYEV
jgi:hypothetical protein